MFARGRRGKINKKKAKEPIKEDFTDDTIHICRQAFDAFDLDKSGRISRDELQASLRSLGLVPTNEEVHQMMLSVAQKYRPELEFTEQRPPTTIGFLEFCSVWVHSLEEAGNEEKLLRVAFNFLDRDHSGALDRSEFESILMNIGDKLTTNEVDKFFNIVDDDGNGSIRYDEFLQLLLCKEDSDPEPGDGDFPNNVPPESRRYLEQVKDGKISKNFDPKSEFKAAADFVKKEVSFVMHLGGGRYLNSDMAQRLTLAGFDLGAATMSKMQTDGIAVTNSYAEYKRRMSEKAHASAEAKSEERSSDAASAPPRASAKVHPEPVSGTADAAEPVQDPTTLPGAPSHVSPRIEPAADAS